MQGSVHKQGQESKQAGLSEKRTIKPQISGRNDRFYAVASIESAIKAMWKLPSVDDHVEPDGKQ